MNLSATNRTGVKPVYESVTFKVIPDPNTRAVAFEAGEVDLLYGTDGIIYPDTYQRFKNMRAIPPNYPHRWNHWCWLSIPKPVRPVI